MPQNLESDFLEAARKLKQKKRKRIGQKIGVLFLIANMVMVAGFAFLFHQGEPILRISNLAIRPTKLFFSILVLILIFNLVIYAIKHQAPRSRYQSSLFPLQLPKFIQIKRIKPRYWLGYTLVLMALVYQANLPIFTNPINNAIVHIKYNPTPPVLNSPWPWKEHEMIHPIVANMPSGVEISIQSVAKYIAQQELDPYLRIKALHDYVVSHVTYDLEVLKTGIRPAQDAQTVFQTHKAVCEGYANLFMALGRAIGVDVVYIVGKVRRDSVPIDLTPKVLRLLNSNYDWTLHAWNAVKISGNWQLVDTTWDDSDSAEPVSSYKADYLMPPPKAMIVSHFPQLDWQLLYPPEDQNAFEKKVMLTPHFFAEDLTLTLPTEYQTNVQKVASIKIESYPNYQKEIVAAFTKIEEAESSFWDLSESNQASQGKQQDIKNCQSQRNSGGETQISCQFPESGDYQVFVYSRGQKSSLIGQLKFHAL